MSSYALSATGAEISMATSFDENYPPENILDGRSETFWASTGLFPQELIISLRSEMNVKAVRISSSNVKKLAIYASKEEEPTTFEKIADKEIQFVEGRLQTADFPTKTITVRHLRLEIVSGHDHFVSIHEVNVDGEMTRR